MFSPVKHVAMVLVIKLCSTAVNIYMSQQDQDIDHNRCTQVDTTLVDKSHTAKYWIRLLPVIGGILSNVFLSYIVVLQIGGLITLLSTVIMALVVGHCQFQIFRYILWILPPLCAGIMEPSLFYGVLQWHRHARHCTIACALIHSCSELGEYLGTVPATVLNSGDDNITLFGVLAGALCVVFAIALQEGPTEEQLMELPTTTRMFRYTRIFAGFIIFVTVMSDDQVLSPEIRNASASPVDLSSIGSLCTGLGTILVACFVKIPIQARIYAGLLIKAAVSAVLLGHTGVALMFGTFPDHYNSTLQIFAELTDGLAKGLAMVAYYEFADSITPRRSMPIVIGTMLTVWGIGGCVSLIVSLAVSSKKQQQVPAFVYHLIALVLVVLCGVYHRFLSEPLAYTIQEVASPETQTDSLDQRGRADPA